MCHYSVGYNYCDIKTTMRWRAEQHERQRVFAFSQKVWVLCCGGVMTTL